MFRLTGDSPTCENYTENPNYALLRFIFILGISALKIFNRGKNEKSLSNLHTYTCMQRCNLPARSCYKYGWSQLVVKPPTSNTLPFSLFFVLCFILFFRHVPKLCVPSKLHIPFGLRM